MLDPHPLPRGLPSLQGADDQTRAIVATLLYYDLFAFAPSAAQVAHFAHGAGVNGHLTTNDLLPESPWWSSQEGYWFLRGREHLIARRAELVRPSARKLAQARRWARRLQLVPGVRFVGVTGSLSMSSAVAEDDIDILVISSAGRLWLTRAWVLAALWAGGVKRADDGRAAHPDEICANIFLSEDDLHIPDHNLFIAHEIGQMLPLLGPATWPHFVSANAWVCEFLPQWEPLAPRWEDRPALRGMQRLVETSLAGRIGDRLEHEFAQRQLRRIRHKHARGHNPGIKLSPTQLRFHARDLSGYVVEAYESHWQTLTSWGTQP